MGNLNILEVVKAWTCLVNMDETQGEHDDNFPHAWSNILTQVWNPKHGH